MIDATYNYIGTVSVKTAREIMRAFPEVEISGITDENEIELVVPDTIDEEVCARLQRIVAVWDTPNDAVIDALFGDRSEKTLWNCEIEMVYLVMVFDGHGRPYLKRIYNNQKAAEDKCTEINNSADNIRAYVIYECVWQ